MNKFTKLQLTLVCILISISTFYGGYYLGKRGFEFEPKRNPPRLEVINKYPPDQQVDFALFWEVWELLRTSHLQRPVDGQKMLYGAIEGMVSSLGDPYTSFLAPDLNSDVKSQLEGNYQGIGAELAIRDDQLIVVAPLDGSPAQAGGVRAGDKILKIDNESTVGISILEAVTKIRGEAGTFVTLTLQRNDSDPFEVRIQRGIITVESVTWEDKGDGNIYIRISQFGTETNSDWARIVSEVNSQALEVDAIVVDVRGNPGGYLESAVYIAEEFFNDAPVLYQESAVGEQVAFSAERVGAFNNIPKLIVLIDEGSASASEILAAALDANADAVLVGQKTFGKGTIQQAKDFEDGSGIHITIAKWLTPSKEWVHGVGITPEVVIEDTNDDINAGRDPQLEKAIELANEI